MENIENIKEISKNISLVYRYIGENIIAELEDIDLTPGLSILLIGIMRNEGSNQRSLADIVHINTATVSKNLRILEKRGFIVRHIDPDNRRSFIINITEAGIEKAKESLSIQYAVWDKIFDNFTKKELQSLSYLSRKVNKNIEILRKG